MVNERIVRFRYSPQRSLELGETVQDLPDGKKVSRSSAMLA